MIPCHVCGKDASTGWTMGFAPAPDSQKMALCAEHDTPSNQDKVREDWEKTLTKSIGLTNDLIMHKAAPGVQLLTVRFVGGGLLTFTCLDCEPTSQGSLRVDEVDGRHTFIPLQHVRTYSLTPLTGGLSAP